MKRRYLVFIIIFALTFLLSCTKYNNIDIVNNNSQIPVPTDLIFSDSDIVFEYTSISQFFDGTDTAYGYNYYDDSIEWKNQNENQFGIKIKINSLYDEHMHSMLFSYSGNDNVYAAIRENINNGNISGLFKIGSSSEINKLAEDGLILPLDEFLKDNENLKSIPIEYRQAYQLDGITYALPSGSYNQAFTRCIRQDWLDTLELKLPTTIMELYDVMKKFTFEDPDGDSLQNTIGANHEGWLGIEDIFASFDVRLNPNGEMLPTWNPNSNQWEDSMVKPEIKECLEFLRNCRSEGLTARTDYAGIGNQFYAGSSGSYCSTASQLSKLAELIKSNQPDATNPSISFIFALTHILDKNINCYSTKYFSPVVLTQNSNYPKTSIAAFINIFMFDKTGQILGTYGPEGYGFNMVQNLVIKKTFESDNKRYSYEGPKIPIGRSLYLQDYNEISDYIYETDGFNASDINFIPDEALQRYEMLRSNSMCYKAPQNVVFPNYLPDMLDKLYFTGQVTRKIINNVVSGYATYDEAIIEYINLAKSSGFQEFLDEQNMKLGVTSGQSY